MKALRRYVISSAVCNSGIDVDNIIANKLINKCECLRNMLYDLQHKLTNLANDVESFPPRTYAKSGVNIKGARSLLIPAQYFTLPII